MRCISYRADRVNPLGLVDELDYSDSRLMTRAIERATFSPSLSASSNVRGTQVQPVVSGETSIGESSGSSGRPVG